MALTRQQAAVEVLLRKERQGSLVKWAEFYAGERGFSLAKHHIYLLEKLQALVDGKLERNGKICRNLIVSMPPGSSKSFYGSVVFPVWVMQRIKDCRVLACSHNTNLIESFSRDCRNTVMAHFKTLDYNLRQDSRAVQEWMTTNNGGYRCAGVGAGIAGRRADVGIIDDYVGSQEDADSKLQRDKVWAWFLSDFWPRLKPNAVTIIIATRWHEEDLIGRLVDLKNTYNSPVDPAEWEVVKFPFFAEDGDLLGRTVGDRIWPEWFTERMADGVRRLPPRVRAGLYQQRPAPEEGNYFKKEWLLTYNQDEYAALMRKNPPIYAAGDWAVSEEDDANRTCFGAVALDDDGTLYILPDIFWKVAGPEEVVTSFVDFIRRRKPIKTRSEKGHISKAWGPFLKKIMLEEQVFAYIEEVTPSKAKDVRARSIQGRMSMLKVKFPSWCSWWPDAIHELLTFPAGKTDDFIDFLAHIGMLLDTIAQATTPKEKQIEDLNAWQPITLTWIKKNHAEQKRLSEPRYQGR